MTNLNLLDNMGMSDCEKCWSTPCSCGWEYKNYNPDSLSTHIASITQYRNKEEAKEILLKSIEIVNKMEKWNNSK